MPSTYISYKPRKKYIRKKRTYGKYKKKGRVGRPSKSLRPSVYFFKRMIEETVELNSSDPPANWVANGNAISRQWQHKLSDILTLTDFTNLFAQYKITGVKYQFFFSNTGSTPSQANTAPQGFFNNAQLLLWMTPSPVGQAVTLDKATVLNTQSAKKRICLNGGKPISVFKKVKQLTMVDSGSITDYAFSRPKWISTLETGCRHYGLNCLIERVDGTAFASLQTDYQSVRVITTYYIACKQVQ